MVNTSKNINGVCSRKDVEYQIDTIWEVEDLLGNRYTLVECDPYGYMIYHNESGNFVEYSPGTLSPFSFDNHCNKMIYAGPNSYYYQKENGIVYSVFGSESLNDNELLELKQYSSALNAQLNTNKNYAILDYISGVSERTLSEIYQESEEESSNRSLSGWTLCNNYSIINGMSDCGYITSPLGGICGYIAAGILLTYKKITGAYNCVDYNFHYYYDSANGVWGIYTTLPAALYNVGTSLGYSNGTTSVAIHYTVDQWLSNRNISVTHTSLYVPFATNPGIASHIDNDRPVIWFGNISSYSNGGSTGGTVGNHAIVVYGYKVVSGNYMFVSHFGWTNASEVTFSGVLGSMYTFQ